jgi:hypothetical protein
VQNLVGDSVIAVQHWADGQASGRFRPPVVSEFYFHRTALFVGNREPSECFVLEVDDDIKPVGLPGAHCVGDGFVEISRIGSVGEKVDVLGYTFDQAMSLDGVATGEDESVSLNRC